MERVAFGVCEYCDGYAIYIYVKSIPVNMQNAPRRTLTPGPPACSLAAWPHKLHDGTCGDSMTIANSVG